MADQIVRTVFTVDATQAFRTADAVEKRYKDLDRKTSPGISGSASRGSVNADGSLTRRGGRDLTLSPEIAKARAEAESTQKLLTAAAGLTVLASGAALLAATAFFAKADEEAIKAEKRLRVLKAALIDLDVSYKELTTSVSVLATTTRLSLEQASELGIAAARAQATIGKSVLEIATAADDLGARRNLTGDQIVEILRDLEQGNINVALGGKAAAASFEIYASALGRTADSLTDVERKQVAVNEFLRQSNLAAGEASALNSTREAELNKLKNTITEFLASVGGALTPGIIDFLQFLRSPNLTGIAKLAVPSIAFLDGLTTSPDQVELLGIDNKTLAETNVKFKEYIALFKENQDLIKRARTNATGDLTSFSLTRFANLDQIQAESNPEVQRRLIAEAIERGKSYGESFKKSINAVLQRGDLVEIRQSKQSFESIKNIFSYDEYVQISQQINKIIEESVNKGIEKARDLDKEFKTVLERLTLTKGANNPYVAFLTESEKAAADLRKQISGLDKDTQEMLLNMERQQRALKLFELRLNTRFEAFDLRDTASRFRDTSLQDRENADKQISDAIQRFIDDQNSGFFRNPAALSQFQSSTASAQSRRDLFDFQRQQEQESGLFRNPAFDELTRNLLGREDEENSVSGKFERQLDILRKSGAQTEEERRLVDRKILSLGNQLTPEELTSVQREAIASAAEREAVRVERAEVEANAIRKEQLEVEKRIDRNTAELIRIAKEQGVKGIEILVKDDTEAGIRATKESSERRPTQESTNSVYEFTGFGIAGGTNL